MRIRFLIRISSLIIGCKRLWVGTGNGVILSIPFSDNVENNIVNSNLSLKPGTIVRINQGIENQPIGSILPYCNLSDSQFSFHGHRDSVKFFLSVPIETLTKTTVNSQDQCKILKMLQKLFSFSC